MVSFRKPVIVYSHNFQRNLWWPSKKVPLKQCFFFKNQLSDQTLSGARNSSNWRKVCITPVDEPYVVSVLLHSCFSTVEPEAPKDFGCVPIGCQRKISTSSHWVGKLSSASSVSKKTCFYMENRLKNGNARRRRRLLILSNYGPAPPKNTKYQRFSGHSKLPPNSSNQLIYYLLGTLWVSLCKSIT